MRGFLFSLIAAVTLALSAVNRADLQADHAFLDLAWVERDAAGATRLRYTVLPPP